jgi:hypothetical protein
MAKKNKYTAAAKKAQVQTDEEYAGIISSLTKIPDNDLEKFFPERADKDKLKELLTIVNSGTSHNEKITKLKENGEKLGILAIKLLKLLA